MNQTQSAPRGGVAPCSRRAMNLAHFMRQAAWRHGPATAFAWGDFTLSWAELDKRIDALAASMQTLGVQKGDRVLLQAKNCNQLFESMFACFRIGAVWVPTNFRQTPEEVAYLATSSGAKIMICQNEFTDHVAAVRQAMPAIQHVIAIGKADFGPDIDSLIDQYYNLTVKEADVEYDDPCWFFYTSGTTGRPKAGVLTHGQMGFVITNHLCDLMPGTTASDASLVVAPLSHGAGIHQLVQVARAVKTVLPVGERLDPDEIWGLVERWQITNMFTVPTIIKRLTEHAAIDRHNHSSLRYVIYAGAPMYREDQKHALRTLGPVLVQYFGLGEVTGNITVLPPALHDAEDRPQARIGTCGFARTAMQISIQDEAGIELNFGETGEICVCGPAVFAGYYDNPEANAKAFRDGWFRTGDLGHLDHEGFLYITGRASDMYISGGSNVYPREIEEKLLIHPDIAEVAVLGMPDPQWGESGVAVIVPRMGKKLSESEVLAFIDGKVARYKTPRQVFFWDELPKSAYGKITKKIVRAELEARGVTFAEPKLNVT